VGGNLPPFDAAVAQFQAILGQIEPVSHQQDSLTVGVKASKVQHHQQAVEKAEVIANALRAFAAVSGDVRLAQQLHFSETDLLRQSTNVVIQLFARIREQALAHVTDLAPYGITEDQVDEFTVLCDSLSEILDSTRNAIVDRRQQTLLLKGLVNGAYSVLADVLDKQVKMLRPTHPELFDLYTAARVIVDYKGKSNKPKVPGGPNDAPPAGGMGNA
jgi:hypothetical protein